MTRLGVLFFLFFAPFSLSAEPLSSPDSVELNLRLARQRLDRFDRSLSLSLRKVLKETPSSRKNSLSPSLRRLYGTRRELKEGRDFWEAALSLKKEILELMVNGQGGGRERQVESDAIARIAMGAFNELRKRYKMIRPPWLHNTLVNLGFKREGFCWHWTRDLRRRLEVLPLTEYELRWATAREGTSREHNTLVIVPRGGEFLEGLLLDGWRRSGRPFWTRVKGDKYPWQAGEYQ